ncbi:MAG: hypothetical protein K0B84_11475 [Firmicutes bacterium]|nr:hypothetical protein [Bacillota bacterium]
MTPRNVAIFITFDLVFLLALLLFLSYYGMSHLVIMLMGIVFLVLTLYDLRTGILTNLFSEFLNLPGPEELGSLRWLPVILSTILLYLSVPVLLEHGLINSAQRWAMQHGHFSRIALPAIAGGAIVIAIAIWTLIRGSKSKN